MKSLHFFTCGVRAKDTEWVQCIPHEKEWGKAKVSKPVNVMMCSAMTMLMLMTCRLRREDPSSSSLKVGSVRYPRQINSLLEQPAVPLDRFFVKHACRVLSSCRKSGGNLNFSATNHVCRTHHQKRPCWISQGWNKYGVPKTAICQLILYSFLFVHTKQTYKST